MLTWGRFHTWETESPWPVHFKQALSLVEKAELVVQVRFHTTLEGPTERSECVNARWMCNLHGDGSCFMVTWALFKNRLLEVGLRQNHLETIVLWMLDTVTNTLQASALIGGEGGAGGPSSLSHYAWGTNGEEWVCECKVDVKSTVAYISFAPAPANI